MNKQKLKLEIPKYLEDSDSEYEPRKKLSQLSPRTKPTLDLSSLKISSPKEQKKERIKPIKLFIKKEDDDSDKENEEISKEILEKKANDLLLKLTKLTKFGNPDTDYIKIQKELASGAFGIVNFYYLKENPDKLYIIKKISYKRHKKEGEFNIPEKKIDAYTRLINEIKSLKKTSKNNCEIDRQRNAPEDSSSASNGPLCQAQGTQGFPVSKKARKEHLRT